MKLVKKLLIFDIVIVFFMILSTLILKEKGSSISMLIVGGMLGYVCMVLYFLPTIQAEQHNHLQTEAIFIINLLLGWTIIGWVVSLAWASTKQPTKA